MARTLTDARRWMTEGTTLFLEAAAALDAPDWGAPSALPGWTNGHLVAHVAANADAIGNLVHWAATGMQTPMYASPAARAEGIALGESLSAAELLNWLHKSAEELDAAMAGLTDQQWQHPVVTAQGRTVPVSETPWMRAREVMVHAADLSGRTGFADLPTEFLQALRIDITDRRGGVPGVEGALPEVVAYLAGRRCHGVTARDGRPAPELGPWL